MPDDLAMHLLTNSSSNPSDSSLQSKMEKLEARMSGKSSSLSGFEAALQPNSELKFAAVEPELEDSTSDSGDDNGSEFRVQYNTNKRKNLEEEEQQNHQRDEVTTNGVLKVRESADLMLIMDESNKKRQNRRTGVRSGAGRGRGSKASDQAILSISKSDSSSLSNGHCDISLHKEKLTKEHIGNVERVSLQEEISLLKGKMAKLEEELSKSRQETSDQQNIHLQLERNHQSFSLLPSNSSGVRAKRLAAWQKGRGKGRANARLLAKSSKSEAATVKERMLNISEVLKSFCTRFVRVNGILFTRTSLETFEEVFAAVKKDLLYLLSSGPMDEFNFGLDAAENGLLIVRLIAVLIFTVHNVNKESDSQSYAEILQKIVLLQNAYTAAFEFTGHLIKRCEQLDDVGSSFLLPAILVFTEWLACHHDIAACSSSETEKRQASARSFFWNQLIILINKVASSGLVTVNEDEDETFMSDISRYDEEETGHRLALWEDFELRGFLPLVPAQVILDFSKMHKRDKQIRAQRLLAAVRVLMNVVRIDQKVIYFDHCHKKFVIGVEPEVNVFMSTNQPDASVLNVTKAASPVKSSSLQKAQLYVDTEDDEEEIVFKPSVAEKCNIPNASASMSAAHEIIHAKQISVQETFQPTQTIQNVNLNTSKWLMDQVTMKSNVLKNHNVGNRYSPNHVLPTPFSPQLNHISQQTLPNINLTTSRWLMEQAALSSGMKNLNINGNGVSTGGLSMPSTYVYPSMVSSSSVDPITRPVGHSNVLEAFTNSTLNATVSSRMTSAVSRPVRHVGPPPGFSNAPSKQLDQPKSESMLNGQMSHIDDYSWLDGYEAPSIKSPSMGNTDNDTAQPSDGTLKFNGATSFFFPGNVQAQNDAGNRKDIQFFEHLMSNSEHQKPGHHV